jgi:putative nucleotidyltransferase with HDIG domain
MTLATASDAVSPEVANHGKRVAYIAMRLADELGIPKTEQYDLALAGALHDIGALALKERLDLLEFELDDPGSHAELGYLFLSRSPLLSNVAQLVRYHHVHWHDGEGQRAHGQPVPFGSHILHLADRIDVLTLRHIHPLGQAAGVVKRIADQRNNMFAPQLVEVFEQLAPREYFWLDIASRNIDQVLERQMSGVELQLGPSALLDLSKLFSQIIDFKSSFTSTHSACVAATAEAIARLVGFSHQECQQMRIAGYLHDLGKLGIPTEILEKAGALNCDEFDIIRSHPYYTRRILESIGNLQTITDWAAAHHERLDGKGYPFHSVADELPLGSRIVAVADVFSALAETRPYRDGMPRTAVLEVLERMVSDGKLDSTVVELLRTYYDEINAKRLAALQEAEAEYQLLVVAFGTGKAVPPAGDAQADTTTTMPAAP